VPGGLKQSLNKAVLFISAEEFSKSNKRKKAKRHNVTQIDLNNLSHAN